MKKFILATLVVSAAGLLYTTSNQDSINIPYLNNNEEVVKNVESEDLALEVASLAKEEVEVEPELEPTVTPEVSPVASDRNTEEKADSLIKSENDNETEETTKEETVPDTKLFTGILLFNEDDNYTHSVNGDVNLILDERYNELVGYTVNVKVKYSSVNSFKVHSVEKADPNEMIQHCMT